MRQTFLLLAVLLPICYAIDVHFNSTYGNGIKRIEVPSCREEPCALIKGQPLQVKITYESTYPKELEFKDVKDANAYIYIDGYRNKYIYHLADIESFCKNQPNDCPLVFHKNYTMDTELFLSADDGQAHSYGFGSRNGKTPIYFNVVLESSNGGTVIGVVVTVMDIQAAH